MSTKSVTYWMCDRCGEVFRRDPGFVRLAISNSSGPVIARTKRGFSSNVQELCPVCRKDFEAFMGKKIATTVRSST